jgi:hypothetical protein
MDAPLIAAADCGAVPVSITPSPSEFALNSLEEGGSSGGDDDDEKNGYLYMGGTRFSRSSSSTGSWLSRLLTPLRALLMVVVVAVGVVAFSSPNLLIPGSKSSSQDKGVEPTTYPTPDIHGGGSDGPSEIPEPSFTTTPRPTAAPHHELSVNGIIPSWLMQEFLTAECQCGSYATILDFCKSHDCTQDMIDGEVPVGSDGERRENQFELAKWVLKSETCLTEACYATDNAGICDIVNLPKPSVSADKRDDKAVDGAEYCKGVEWKQYAV